MQTRNTILTDSAGVLRVLRHPLQSFVRRFEADRFDLLAPERIVDGLQARVEALVERMPGRTITEGLLALLRHDAVWRQGASRAGLTPEVRALCEYFAALNATWPYASTILVMGSRYFRRAMFVDLLRGVGQHQRASTARRERRSEWLRQASLTIIENLFYELVSFVYAAECLRRGDRMNAPRGGRQLRYVASHTADSLPGLFRGDENRLRNAAAHCDRWCYRHSTNSIHLSDFGWTGDFSTTELLDEVRTLLEKSFLPLQIVLRLHGPDARTMLSAVLTDDRDGIAAIGAEWGRTATELRRLGWTEATDRHGMLATA